MYAVIKNGAFEKIATGNTHWSPNHFQTAESLSPAERARFNLYLVVDVQGSLTATQKWGTSTYVISGTDVIRTWVPVAKTPAEIATDVANSNAAFNATVHAQIATIESKQHRATREHVLAPNAVDPVTLRNPAQQIGFLDGQIVTLRATLK